MKDRTYFVCKECGNVKEADIKDSLCVCGQGMFIFGEEYISFPKKASLFLSNIKYWENAIKSLHETVSMMSEEVFFREDRKLRNRIKADELCYYNFMKRRKNDKI